MTPLKTKSELDKYYLKNGGFIALFSVIIISFVLVLVAITLSFTGFFTRFDILDSENKKRSESLADACIEQARLEIAQNSTYANSLTIGSDSCGYLVNFDATEIIASSTINNAHTYYWVKINENYSIIDFKECPTSSPCP